MKVLKVFVYHADTLLTSRKTKQAVGGFRLLLVFTFTFSFYFFTKTFKTFKIFKTFKTFFLKVLKVLKILKVLKVFVYHADTLLTGRKTKQAVGGFRLLLVFTFYGLYFIILYFKVICILVLLNYLIISIFIAVLLGRTVLICLLQNSR